MPMPGVVASLQAALAEAQAVPSAIAVGVRVRVNSTVKPAINIRGTPSTGAPVIGTQPLQAQGTVVGALTANFWQINFDSGVDGWAWHSEVFLVGASMAPTIAALQAAITEAQAVQTPPPPATGVLANLAPNTLRNCGTYIDTEQADWTQKSRNIGDDSGTVADPVGRQFIAFGGAHGPMQASNPRAFSTDTGLWRNMHLSTRWADMLAANADLAKGRWIDTNTPIARHTYSQQVVAAAVGARPRRLYEMSAYLNPDNLPGPNLPFVYGKVAWMDLEGANANKWTFGNVAQPWYFAGGAVYDAIGDCIYIVSMRHVGGALENARIWRYDIAGDSYVEGPVVGGLAQPLDVQWCGDDGKLYVFENGGVVRRLTVDRANLQATTSEILTTTGPTPPQPGRPFGYPVCSWVPSRHRFGGWFNAGKYREFDPATLEWSETVMLMEAGSSGTNVGAIFSCGNFEEWSGCFVFLDTENVQKTWVYRPPPAIIPPPPPVTVPVPIITPINTTRVFCFVKDFAGNEQYSRRQYEIEIEAGTLFLDAHTTQLGGTIFPLDHPRYELFFDGVLVSSYNRVSTEKVARFTLPNPLPAGLRDRLATFVAKDAGGNVVAGFSSAPCGVIVNQDGNAAAEQTHVYIQNTSHDWDRGKPFRVNVRMPVTAQARPIPYTLAPATEFTNQPVGNQLVREMVVPGCETNNMTTHYLGKRLSGVWSGANIQGYFNSDLQRAYPVHSAMDGVRGIATMRFPLSIKPGRNGRAFYTDLASMGKITADGTKTTRWGIRHRWPIDWTQASLTHPAVEFVGNCLDPSIPQLERYPDHTWSWDYDPDSLALSGTRPPQGNPPEQPHVADVRWHQTDRRGWLWECLTPGDQFDGPVSFRRHLLGLLNKPFSSRHVPGTRVLLVSEEGARHVSRWDADTYQSLGLEVEGLPHPVQDLGIWNGWLYFSMFERTPGVLYGKVCRKPLGSAPTAPYEVVASPSLNSTSGEGSRFVSFCINDNTLDADGKRPKGGFGPDGTLFVTTFHNQQFGRPQAFVLNPSTGVYSEWGGWHSYGYNIITGRGPVYSNDVYPCAPGAGYGRLWFGSSINCLYVHRLANAGDPPAPNAATIAAGHNEFLALGLDKVYGAYAYGPFPPPFGRGANIDAFLLANGHAP